jgi:hypothetical protein
MRMNRKRKLWLAGGVVALAAGGYAAYLHYSTPAEIPAVEIVSALPSDATTVFYVDLAALRQSPLLAGLRAFAPVAATDKEYADFVRETGFDFERDLDRAAMATADRAGSRVVYALAEGRFDKQKISAFALKSGRREERGGNQVFTTPVSGSPQALTFAFSRKGTLALTDGGDLGPILSSRGRDPARDELAERARRLAGSPVFVVLRPSREALAAFATRLPGALRSDQLVALAAQLRWISIALLPDGERTKIVLEGESLSEVAPRQIAGALESLLLIARIALDDPKARARMDPAEYAALADLLKTAEVSRLDRGETKAVRLILSAGPELFAALLSKPAQAPVAPAPSAGNSKK